MVRTTSNLDDEAIAILKANDRGGYTVPTGDLYPYQWNWDSAFVALGFMSFDRDRAWRELRMLLQGQWDNGMLPHILFRRYDDDYFPGVHTWNTADRQLPSSGISQPPVLASVVLRLVETGGYSDLENARTMFLPLVRWHRWFFHDRVCQTTNVLGTVHPWESGRDNSPDWFSGISGMDVDPELENYERTDLLHADVNHRPSRDEYDRYISIVKYGRDHDWDQKVLTNEGPFLMADPCISFIYLRANKDLLKLSTLIDAGSTVQHLQAEIQTWIDHGHVTSEHLWNEEIEAYCARNLRTGEFSNGFSSASALCLYAGVGSGEQQARTLDHIERVAKKVKLLLPSWDPEHARFEPQRYWCGPVWPQMNQLIYQGLVEVGQPELATKLRDDLAFAIQHSGFWECFDPLTAEGCVGQNFSWTASAWLSWASPSAEHSSAQQPLIGLGDNNE